MAQLRRLGGGGAIYFSDYQAFVSELRSVDRKLHLELRKKYREIAKPVVDDVKRAIPSSAPLAKPRHGGGLVTKVGRLSYSRTMNQKRPIKSINVKEKTRVKASTVVSGLATVRVMAAPVTLLDMAGKKNKVRYSGETREYDYTYTGKYGGKYVAKRTHRLNGQGAGLIEKLGGKASRYVWPAAEKALPGVQREATKEIDKFVNDFNQTLKKANM